MQAQGCHGKRGGRRSPRAKCVWPSWRSTALEVPLVVIGNVLSCANLSCPVWVGDCRYVREKRPRSGRQTGYVDMAWAWHGHIVTLHPPVDACTVYYPRVRTVLQASLVGACHVVVVLTSSGNRLCQDREPTEASTTTTRQRRRQHHRPLLRTTTRHLRVYRLVPTALSRRLA